MKVMPKQSRIDYLAMKESLHEADSPDWHLSDEEKETILSLPYSDNEYHTNEVVNMKNISIQYGQRIILKSLDWIVRNGERWALSGQNGAGKSTLLSLVCADNPQSYACNIVLFDRKRGSGEAIWDIKKHIGYVSPEMHRAFRSNVTAERIVASGFSNAVSLYVKPDPSHHATCLFWMQVFGIGHLASTSFLKLSSGEQRLVPVSYTHLTLPTKA